MEAETDSTTIFLHCLYFARDATCCKGLLHPTAPPPAKKNTDSRTRPTSSGILKELIIGTKLVRYESAFCMLQIVHATHCNMLCVSHALCILFIWGFKDKGGHNWVVNLLRKPFWGVLEDP